MKARSLQLALNSVATLLVFITEFGGGAIHIWTTVIGYQDGGSAGAIATFLLPFLSEAYWFWYAWRHYGFLGSWYGVSVVGLIATWLCWAALVSMLAYFRPGDETPEHWTICNDCGTAFSEGVFCQKCGGEG